MTGILLVLLMAVPAAGALAAPARSVMSLQRMLQVTVGLWFAISLGWIASAVFGLVPATAVIEIAALVELDAEASGITLNAEISPVRVGLLLSGLLVLLPKVLSGWLQLPPFVRVASSGDGDAEAHCSQQSLRLSLGILSAGTLALLSDDLVVVAAAWLLLDTLLIRLADRQSAASCDGGSELSSTTPGALERRSLLTVLRLSSVALLAAVLLAATRYHTTSLVQFVDAAASDVRVDAAVVRGGILVWFALAVAGRAALFPAGIWLRSLTASTSRETLALTAWAALLPALGLWVSLAPLLPLALESSLLIAALSGLSGIMLGAIAVASPQSGAERHSLLLLAIVAAVALMSVSVPALAGEALMNDAALTATLVVLLSVSAVCVLSMSAKHHLTKIAAAAFLLSGFGGTNYLLDELQSLRRTLPTVADSADISLARASTIDPGVCTGLWWAVCAIQLLIGMIVMLKLMQGRPTRSDAKHDRQFQTDDKHVRDIAAPAVLVLAAVGAVCLAWIALPDVSMAARSDLGPLGGAALRPLLSFNAATPAGLLGGVCVWLFLRAPDAIRNRLRRGSATLERLALNWFYAGEIVMALRKPVVWAALIVEACDRRILGGRHEDAWRLGVSRAGRSIEEIGEHGAAYPSLAALLAVAGLLLALAGFGR